MQASHATEARPQRKGRGKADLTVPGVMPKVLQVMKTYMCLICGYVYDEQDGDPDAGIAPGTRWDDVPLSWRCPDCGAGKEDFEMVEV